MASNVYVANYGSDSVSIFDRNTLTGSLTSNSTIATGSYPYGIAVSNDGKSVYVSSSLDSSIAMYNRDIVTGTLSGIGAISTGTAPYGICVSNDNLNVYVVNFNTNTVTTYNRNVLTGTLIDSGTYVATELNPFSIAISNDGKSVYVTNINSASISIFNRNVLTGALTVGGTISAAGGPRSICISNDNLNVYVVNSNANNIFVYNRNISTGELVINEIISSTGNFPSSICISNDGKSVYVTNTSSHDISIYDRNTTTGELSGNGTIGTGLSPQFIIVSEDALNVYATSFNDGTVSIYDRNVLTGALTFSQVIASGINPRAIAIFPRNAVLESALLIDVQPYGVVSGDPFTTQPIIKIVDSNGYVVPTATNDVEATITIVNGSGSLSGTTTISAVNGYATFTDLTFTGDASFYLTFTATGLTPVDSNEIATLTPVSILMETQPVAGVSGDQFLTQPVVKIVNWLNEIVPTYSDDVVCTLVVVSGSPVLTGTTSVTPSSGYATYTDLVVTGSGSFYLQFTSGSLNQVDSNTIYFLPDPGNPNPPIPVKPKRSYIPLSVPTANDMEINEFAINVVDKKGYVCDSNGVVHQVFDGSQGVSSIIAGTGISVNNSTGNVTISTIASSPSLEQLTDVQITNKQNGQILRYLVSAQKWVNSNTIDGGNF